MKITIEDLLEKQVAIQKVLEKELPFKLAYRLGKIADAMVSEFKHIEKTRREMISKFGETDEETGNKKVSKDKKEDFNKEWDAFIEGEIEFRAEKIPWKCIEGMELSAFDVANIMCFLADKPKEETKPKKNKKGE